MKKKVQMKKMAGVFLALAIVGIGLFPPGNVYAAGAGEGEASCACS